MSNRIGKAFGLLREPSIMSILGTLRYNGCLAEWGWFDSVRSQSPINGLGEPIPWMTYPFIRFIEKRLSPGMELFEFGSGNSTRYFAQHVGSITSVEHDRDWYEKVATTLPANANLVFRDLVRGGEYCKTATSSNRKYDLIIVDGRDRVNCVRHSIDALKENGVLLLDDAQRSEYREAIELLQSRGFRQLSFTGMAPCTVEEKNTDIFYRPSNCLNI